MSNNHRSNFNLPHIHWWMIIAGFTVMSPLGIVLLVLKIIQESAPKPERWGQTSPLPTQKVRAQTQEEKTSDTHSADVWKKPKYPLVKLKDGKLFTIVGACVAGLFGLTTATIFGDWGLAYWNLALSEAIPAIAFTLAGIGSMIWGHFKTKRIRKFKSYLARLGNEPLVPLRPLAESIPASMDEVFETFQQMIDEGVFGDHAYLDVSTETLVLDSRAAKPSPKAKPAPKQEPAAPSSEEEILRQIRHANDLIPGEEVSRKIDRIEEITRHILLYLKKHPERSGELHTFLDYYLPTTLKMLNAYAELDGQQIGTENIAATKRRIEGILDKVVEGFEAQLDKLFVGDMLDIASDIDVMEKMLSRDGLSNDMKVPKAGTSSSSGGYTPNLTLDPDESGSAAAQQRPW